MWLIYSSTPGQYRLDLPHIYLQITDHSFRANPSSQSVDNWKSIALLPQCTTHKLMNKLRDSTKPLWPLLETMSRRMNAIDNFSGNPLHTRKIHRYTGEKTHHRTSLCWVDNRLALHSWLQVWICQTVVHNATLPQAVRAKIHSRIASLRSEIDAYMRKSQKRYKHNYGIRVQETPVFEGNDYFFLKNPPLRSIADSNANVISKSL